MTKSLLITALLLATTVARADFKSDGLKAVGILYDRPSLNLVCIARGLAFGVFYSEADRSVMVAFDNADKFGNKSTQISKSLPGPMKVNLPKSVDGIPANMLLGKDEDGNKLGIATGSMGVEKNIPCAYRANEILFEKIVQFPSPAGIQLE